MRCLIPGSHRERLRNADKGKLRPYESTQSAAQALFCEQLVGYEAEAARGIGQQTLLDIQPLRGIRQDAGKAADSGGLRMVRREVGLVDGKTAQTIHSAVRADHGDAQQYRLLCGTGQGDELCGAAAALYGRGRFFQMLRKAGEARQVKFLRPLPVGHHLMPPPDVRHAAIEEQVAGGVLGVAALHIQSGVGIHGGIRAERDIEQGKRAGAIRLPRILAQRLQHGLLQGAHGGYVSVERGKVRGLLLNEVCHILRKMDAHDRDIPPQGGHIRAKGPHLEGQGLFRFSPWAFELPKQKQGDKQHRQQQKRQCAHV